MNDRKGLDDADEAAVHQGKGLLNQLKGRVKHAVGDLTDNGTLKREGTVDRVKGKVQEEYGNLKEDLNRKV